MDKAKLKIAIEASLKELSESPYAEISDPSTLYALSCKAIIIELENYPEFANPQSINLEPIPEPSGIVARRMTHDGTHGRTSRLAV